MLHNIWQLNPTVLLFNSILREVSRFDIIHTHSYIFFSSNQLSFYRLLKRFPLVLHLHGGFGDLDPNLVGYMRFVAKRFYDKTVARMTLKAVDKIVSVSKVDADYVMSRYNIPESKVVAIPNAVDSSRFKLAVDSNPKIACFIGRLTKWKGSSHMPRIFNSLVSSGVHVRVVGYGPEMSYLKERCNPKVEFMGFVPKHKIPSMLEDASVLLLPSFVEGLPTVCLEAMSAGIPSVAYDVGGVRECVRDGVTGFTVRRGDVNAFVSKTLRALDFDGFTEDCLRIAKNEYDWKIVTNKIEEVYTCVKNLKK